MEIQEKVISFLENRKMPVKRAAGFVIFRYIQKEGSTKAREWLLLQTSYGQHHWTPPTIVILAENSSCLTAKVFSLASRAESIECKMKWIHFQF